MREESSHRWASALWRQVRRLNDLLPTPPALGPVIYTPALVTYVVSTYVVAGVAAVVSLSTVHLHLDPTSLAVGGAAIFLMSVYAIRLINISWVPTTFVHLGLSAVFGPVGGVVGAVAESVGVSIRNRNGWVRTFFNMSNHFLANLAAWGAFAAINRGSFGGPVKPLAAGLAAGFAHFVVNSVFVAVVIHLSDTKIPFSRALRPRLNVMPYSIGYGFATFAFVVMQQHARAIGFLALLAPVIVLHVYLIIFANKSHAIDVERIAFDKERERLLIKEMEASERERTKIAGDLHDGVVQNLAGLALELSAEASRLKGRAGSLDGREELLELLERSATETRGAMKDLRTLIIDLAPPTLRREGLQAALLEVLRDIKRKGTNTHLDLQPNLRLRKDRAALIFRVAQEVLRNVAAHAQAKNVKVELVTEDGSAILSIEDDGKGFTPEDVARRRSEHHLGTSAIVDLAEEAGGTLTIDSEPGRGTLVVLTLPIG
ncbi:MAG: ATP-binding protein [Candidatus Dormiibacterota bacterium]